MSLNRYDTRRDENEPEIMAALRGCGLSVYAADKPLDLIVGHNGLTELAEVKMPRNKRGDPKPYTPAQEVFLGDWTGGHTLLVTVDDALNMAARMKAKSRLLRDMGVSK